MKPWESQNEGEGLWQWELRGKKNSTVQILIADY